MTTITRAVLKKAYTSGKGAKDDLAVYLPILLFATVSMLVVPFPFGQIAAAVVILLGGLYKTKMKKLGLSGDPLKSYFRRLPLAEKIERQSDNDDGNAYAYYYLLRFGEHDLVEVKSDAFRDAEVGKPYYVAYFKENDKAFLCFPADAYTPAEGMELRS